MNWPNGDKYTGQFKNGKRHGRGIRKNADGSVFEGNYEEDQPSGQGKYTWADGESYDGAWKNGLFHGMGIKKLPDGTVYDGLWDMGLPKGLGVCHYPD